VSFSSVTGDQREENGDKVLPAEPVKDRAVRDDEVGQVLFREEGEIGDSRRRSGGFSSDLCVAKNLLPPIPGRLELWRRRGT
jgi:hypothetical protein